VAKLHGFEHEHELENQIGQMDVDALGRFCLDCALVDQVRVHAYRLESQPENLLQAAKHYGVDIEAPGAPEQDGEQA